MSSDVSRFPSGTGRRKQEFVDRFVLEAHLPVRRFTAMIALRVNHSRVCHTSYKTLVEVVNPEASAQTTVMTSSVKLLTATRVESAVSRKVHSRTGKIISDDDASFVTRKLYFNKRE